MPSFSIYTIACAAPEWATTFAVKFVSRWANCAYASLEYVPSNCPQCGGKDQNDIQGRCTASADITGEYYCALTDTENPGREYWLADDDEYIDEPNPEPRVMRATPETWNWLQSAEGLFYTLIAAQDTQRDRKRNATEKRRDEAAVDAFASAMKAKLNESRKKGRNSWHDPNKCPIDWLAYLCVSHVEKGDPVDVGNLAAMLFARGETGNGGELSSALTKRITKGAGHGTP